MNIVQHTIIQEFRECTKCRRKYEMKFIDVNRKCKYCNGTYCKGCIDKHIDICSGKKKMEQEKKFTEHMYHEKCIKEGNLIYLITRCKDTSDPYDSMSVEIVSFVNSENNMYTLLDKLQKDDVKCNYKYKYHEVYRDGYGLDKI